MNSLAVQNERDRINCRRPSYEEQPCANGLSVTSLLNAEILSRSESDVSSIRVIVFDVLKKISFNVFSPSITVFYRRPKILIWQTSTWQTSATCANQWKLSYFSWSTGLNAYQRLRSSSLMTKYVINTRQIPFWGDVEWQT